MFNIPSHSYVLKFLFYRLLLKVHTMFILQERTFEFNSNMIGMQKARVSAGGRSLTIWKAQM
ncbi:hypothetical protein PT2222_130259 [Paraburkholderia tropica]